jgi:hypothetical protein
VTVIDIAANRVAVVVFGVGFTPAGIALNVVQ